VKIETLFLKTTSCQDQMISCHFEFKFSVPNWANDLFDVGGGEKANNFSLLGFGQSLRVVRDLLLHLAKVLVERLEEKLVVRLVDTALEIAQSYRIRGHGHLKFDFIS